MTGENIWAIVPSLVDDMPLITDPANEERSRQILSEELGHIGLELSLSKYPMLLNVLFVVVNPANQ